MPKFINTQDTANKPLNPQEFARVKSLNDPLIGLIVINAWRRSEISQAIINDDGTDYAHFIPKYQNKLKHFLMTKAERDFLDRISDEIVKTTKRTRKALNQALNRHFVKISDIAGVRLTPHIIRATAATMHDYLGASHKVVSKIMNHTNPLTTYKYIQPQEFQVFEAKEIIAEMNTFEGMTIQE
ncbi:UNVERIFIED_CONTAM: site-specific integrase [Kocuria sp. CPCC 205274]